MSEKRGAKSNPQSTAMARLTAVQALYEIEMTNTSIDNIFKDFTERRWDNNTIFDKITDDNNKLALPDKKKFTAIIRGVIINQGTIIKILDRAVSKNIYFDKLDSLIKSILLCATYEICFENLTPNKVVLNEYINITKAFYEQNESSLVNGVLDRIAKMYDKKICKI